MRPLFWTVVGAALLLYGVILFWSLPQISADAGGLAAFDLRPVGYDRDEAKAFLTALSPAGRDFYLSVQHRLDLVFPPLMALALGWATLLLAPPPWRKARWLLAAPAGLGAVLDLLENRAVAALLATPPDALTAEAVARASPVVAGQGRAQHAGDAAPRPSRPPLAAAPPAGTPHLKPVGLTPWL